MPDKNLGILHPGAMGISVAVSGKNSGNTVYWVSDGRSTETRGRAEKHGLVETATLSELCETCSVLISVCPPHAAEDVAREVLTCSYTGMYADVNAISPDRSRRIGALLQAAGIEYVDGGIIGGPAWNPGSTWLYVSGDKAAEIAGCFSKGPLETEVIGSDVGKASALKMCFAANTKGGTALLTAVVAAAEKLGVLDDLERQWNRHNPSAMAEAESRIRGVSLKAWRFAGEMEEIASTFESAGIPGGFHRAAKEIYERITEYKGADPLPDAHDVISTLIDNAPET
jgi:3-hydroxyisobutyrate dehydrogenase-like beta-hydroxyacid dehydrogenase